MTIEEIKLRRLSGQHVLAQEDVRTVLKDVCGVQAQFLSHAFHALRIRSRAFDESQPTGMMKNWTLRGTMHLFDESDLPIMLHKDRVHFLRPCDTFSADEFISAERKRFFADVIVRSIDEGIGEREALKERCFSAGMTEAEAQSVFNPWGGTIRALCEQGVITHAVSERKAFVSCPAFEPMEKDAAQLELARRYFSHYGPATIRDAAYFFGCTQTAVKHWLERLPVRRADCDGRTYYYIEETAQLDRDIPDCIFLAGFDPLMLGYEKKENPFLPPEHLRSIFSRAGMVMPAVLLHGRVVGRWKKQGRKLSVSLFETVSSAGRNEIAEQAAQSFEGISAVKIEE